MAVNQSQVDHIITAASEDDPEVKLQNLEREVDLIKTSIKRLLMDIRERMNELENPFTLTASGSSGTGTVAGGAPSGVDADVDEARKSALEAREAALDARESQLDATRAKMESETVKEEQKKRPDTEQKPVSDDKSELNEQMLALLKTQLGAPQKPTPVSPQQPGAQPASEKLRLQKVYKLFKWTHQSVKKFGHDRLEIMLESYKVMGYISRESADEIREISRLMPANLGEEHEVGPDEFVAELYALNRILAPNDTSLDRDMIEVMMEQRGQEPGSMDAKTGERINLADFRGSEKKSSSRNNEKDEEWMNLPDGFRDMSAETFTSALFLITAIIAAGVLINAVFPVVYNMAGTFSSASHESDQRIRTDFKIITTSATTTTTPPTATIWIKNVGSSRIAYTDIYRSDVFCGTPGQFDRLTYTSGDPVNGQWTVYFTPGQESNLYWDPGETIKVEAKTSDLPSTSGGQVYFQFILPNGIWRSTEFTAR